jgi:Protein of unknown function (DUF1553)/Protein of unknown function (DUF1549)/Planctomycete cytochrome C
MRIAHAAVLFGCGAYWVQAAPVSFHKDVRPLLEDRCAMCHSADARTSGFEVSSVAALLKGGAKAGASVIPGKPDESPLIDYLTGKRTPRMPREMPALTAAEIGVIRNWIAEGAKDDSPDSSTPVTASARPLSDSDKLLNQALFSANAEQLMLMRRKLRLAYLPKPPEPPAGSADSPIDRFIQAKWQGKRLPELSTDAEFLRRVYLDVIGVIPTIQEAQSFLADRTAGKREKQIDALLARDADYAANWTPFWEEAIASSDTGVVGGIVRHGNYQEWIYNSFLINKPYDVMAAELIDPFMPNYQKPVPEKMNGDYSVYPSFVLNSDHIETIQTAANTAQVFLGTGMKCASCHNHFLNSEWPQARFLAFASLFAAKDLELIRCEAHTGRFVNAAFPFQLPDVPNDVPADVPSRLHRLAQLLTDPMDDRFSKTIVNRLWKRYLGLGLFEPVDDYRADRPASHPEMLDWLAYDFMQHGYDLKHTIRLILTSRTYQLRYDPALEDHFDIGKPSTPRYFRSPSLRRLTAEELLDSMQLAEIQKLNPTERLYKQANSTDLTRALGRPAARNEVSTGRPEDVAVVQSLELLNGQEFHDRVYNAQILKDGPTVERLYWAVFNRPPTVAEVKAGEEFLKDNAGAEGWGDMLWAMFVSPGFAYVQ